MKLHPYGSERIFPVDEKQRRIEDRYHGVVTITFLCASESSPPGAGNLVRCVAAVLSRDLARYYGYLFYSATDPGTSNNLCILSIFH
jgi:hypothetical protein